MPSQDIPSNDPPLFPSPHSSTPGESDLLREWLSYCKTRSDMHNLSEKYYGTLTNAITIPAIAIAAFSSVAAISFSTNMDCGNDADGNSTKSLLNWLTIGLSSLNLVSASVLTIVQYLKLSEMTVQCGLVSNEYDKLALEIQMHTSVGRETAMFRNHSELVKHIKRQIDSLIDRSAPIPKHIERRAIQEAANANATTTTGQTFQTPPPVVMEVSIRK